MKAAYLKKIFLSMCVNVLKPELSSVMEEIYQLLKLDESTFVSTVKFVGIVKKNKVMKVYGKQDHFF